MAHAATAVVVSMLRGVNLAKHNRMKMEDLRAVYESLKLTDPRTYVQSGNVVFRTREQNLDSLARRIETGVEKTFGFRPDVILRTSSEMRDVIARNPFASRQGIEPNKLLVTFLAGDPDPEAREKLLQIDTGEEEFRVDGRQVYIYYTNGLARPKISWVAIARALKTSGTGRNWNTVTKLLELAETLSG